MSTQFGLPQRTLDEMHAIFAKYSKVKKVMIYGSRAMGNYKNGSDIDLTMYGDDLTYHDLSRIAGELDESSIPYLVDLSIYDALDHVKLKDHINRRGQVFYDRYAGWETMKLGEICDFVRGPFGGSLKKSMFVDEGYAVYEQQHPINNQCSYFRYFITKEKFSEMSRFQVKSGDILMSCSGTIGKTTIVPSEAPVGIINQALLKISPHQHLNVSYLQYFMSSKLFSEQLMNTVDGTAIQNVASVKILKEIQVFLPPLAEQQRIVAKLDTAFAEIDESIALAEKQVIQTTVFGYRAIGSVMDELTLKFPNKALNEAVTIQPKKRLALEKVGENENVSFMGMDKLGIEQKYSKPDEAKPLKDVYKSYQYFEENDVIFAKITPCFENGKLGIVHNLTNGIGFGSSEFVVLRPKSELFPDFVYFCLLNETFRKEGAENMSGAVGHKRVTKNYYFHYSIPVPPKNVQIECVKKLDEIWKQTTRILKLKCRKADNLTSLKTAILAQELQIEVA